MIFFMPGKKHTGFGILRARLRKSCRILSGFPIGSMIWIVYDCDPLGKNGYQGHSPGSANLLKRLIGQTVVDPESLVKQPSLF